MEQHSENNAKQKINQSVVKGNDNPYPDLSNNTPIAQEGQQNPGPEPNEQKQPYNNPNDQQQDPPPSQNNNEINTEMSRNLDKSTYIRVGSEEFGIIDIDLVTYRQKDEEVRYLLIESAGFSGEYDEAGNPVPTKTSVMIDSEEQFNKLKDFISNLDWND